MWLYPSEESVLPGAMPAFRGAASSPDALLEEVLLPEQREFTFGIRKLRLFISIRSLTYFSGTWEFMALFHLPKKNLCRHSIHDVCCLLWENLHFLMISLHVEQKGLRNNIAQETALLYWIRYTFYFCYSEMLQFKVILRLYWGPVYFFWDKTIGIFFEIKSRKKKRL